MIQKNFLIILISGLLILSSCGSDPLDVDASHLSYEGKFVNVENVIFHADSVTLMKEDQRFRSEIPDIYEYFRGYCLRIGDVKDTAFYNSIQLFRADTIMQIIDSSIRSSFDDMSLYEEQITDGFKHLKYHFKDGKQPKNVVYLNSVFQSNIFCTENEIGIGLERYLGPDNYIIKNLDPSVIFQWIKDGMRSEFIVRDLFEGWVETHYMEDPEGNLAEQMIRSGKIIYLVEASLPEMDDHLIMRYSEDQLAWAKENEYAFWKYLVDEKLLFETNERNNTNMLKPGPTTSGLPIQGSPDRMGVYLGWRMIHSYMEQNDVSLEEMLKVPYNKILNDYEIDE